MAREPAKSFEDLIVWQKAHQWVLSVYKQTEKFPNEEKYGLISQLRRSAVSVPANIAEGFKKRGKADKVRFINIAQGSLEESRCYLILAKDLGYLEDSKNFILCEAQEEISRMMESYATSIKNSNS
ncbi:MAG: four helix bundle protein [Nitrospinaceae bacterium]|nr:MAG: four helix bundle protein [Nitrospinaceae bacterium]